MTLASSASSDGLFRNVTAELFGRARKRRITLLSLASLDQGNPVTLIYHLQRLQGLPATPGYQWFLDLSAMLLQSHQNHSPSRVLAEGDLKALGFEINSKGMTAFELFELWKQQLIHTRTLFLVIEECPRVLNGEKSHKVTERQRCSRKAQC